MDAVQQTIMRGKASTPKRVQNACVRCHKQKLKCDDERPCALCIRSSMECVENIPRNRGGRTAKPKTNDPERHSHVRHTSQSHSSLSGLPSPASLCRSEQTYEERPSTYPLVNHMFEKYNSGSGHVQSNADAIPDGSPSQRTFSSNVKRVSVSDLIGIDLPSRDVTNMLLDSYLKHIHWFIMVIHEPTLRAELDEITTYGTLQTTRLSFLSLILVILAFGSNYITDGDAGSLGPTFDRHNTEKTLIKKVEEKFLEICDSADIESIQTGLILSAYYVYLGHPKRASIVYDATLTCAKALGLHRESLWKGIDPLTKEIRRRVWWAVYAGDGFSAVNFGRPCSINDTDWDVKMVCNIDDTSITCPGFQSMETLEDGSIERVTILSYRRCKYKLYQIVSAILKSVYFTRDTSITIEETARRVKAINERLLAWERSVPPELRLSSFEPDSTDRRRCHILETFQLQALALHLFYNNIQLLLHRPLLTYTGFSRRDRISTRTTSDESSMANSRATSPTPAFCSQAYQSSKSQCWESAMQTTKISNYKGLLLAARNTPVAPYIGIQAFTAGAVLGLFALSAPLTSVSLEAKRALGKLIKMPQSLEFHSLVSDQCGNVLKDLVHLILSEETRLLTADVDGTSKESLSGNLSAQPAQPITKARELVPTPAESHWPDVGYDHPRPNNQDIPSQPSAEGLTQSLEIVEKDDGGFVYGDDPLALQETVAITAGEDFNHALLSLQTVFGDERIRTIGQHPFSHDDPSSMMSFASTVPASTFNAEMGFDDTSQTWIWGDNFDFR